MVKKAEEREEKGKEWERFKWERGRRLEKYFLFATATSHWSYSELLFSYSSINKSYSQSDDLILTDIDSRV